MHFTGLIFSPIAVFLTLSTYMVRSEYFAGKCSLLLPNDCKKKTLQEERKFMIHVLSLPLSVHMVLGITVIH